jgi:hypothetical protein
MRSLPEFLYTLRAPLLSRGGALGSAAPHQSPCGQANSAAPKATPLVLRIGKPAGAFSPPRSGQGALIQEPWRGMMPAAVKDRNAWCDYFAITWRVVSRRQGGRGGMLGSTGGLLDFARLWGFVDELRGGGVVQHVAGHAGGLADAFEFDLVPQRFELGI